MMQTENMSERSDDRTPLPVKPGPARPSPRSGFAVAALGLALVAAAVAGWQWFDVHRTVLALQQDMSRRFSDSDARVRDTRSLASQSRDGLRDAEARLGQLEARMVETQNQRVALESLYQDLSRSRDELTLAQIEQVLLIASQQLQLAGNVKAALSALEAADARLARTDRPQVIGLRRVIHRDIERLRSVPQIDVVGMAVRLDLIASRVQSLPLAMEGRPATPAPPPDAPNAGVLKRAWREFIADLRGLVRIQRIDRDEIPMLSPGQTYFLRENLRIRLLGARLALLARDEASFRSDLRMASEWMERYYDTHEKEVATALSTLGQLLRSEISIQLPDISASLDAVRALKIAKERTLR